MRLGAVPRLPACSLQQVVNPREALTMIDTFLRSRDEFVLEVNGGTLTTDAGSFYGAVVRGLCPTMMRALRHCLNPANPDLARATTYLQGVVGRLCDLLVAADELGRLAQIEGHMGGNNTVFDRQLYHLQNSVVLFSGCLDMLAWIVAVLQGEPLPDKRAISWSAVRRTGSDAWVNQLSSSEAKALVMAARTLDQDRIDDAISLRDSYQHRLPMQGGIVEVNDQLGIVRTRIGAIDWEATGLHPSDPASPGILETDGLQLLIPHSYQRGMISCLVGAIETVLAAREWPDDYWWKRGHPLTELDSDRVADKAVWLFGPLG
jgi:hypothetical protein